jgi:hypothetical protein
MSVAQQIQKRAFWRQSLSHVADVRKLLFNADSVLTWEVHHEMDEARGDRISV